MKNTHLLAVYELEHGDFYPAAMILMVQEEHCQIVDSEYFLNLMLEQELGGEVEYQVALEPLEEEQIPSLYAKPKLIQEVFDPTFAFADHFVIRVDEDYLFDLETSLR